MKSLICSKCGNSFPTRVKHKDKIVAAYKRKYCFDCSPIFTHNTKKLNGEKNSVKKIRCDKFGPKYYVLFEKAKELSLAGHSQRMISKKLGVAKCTITKWFKHADFPQRSHKEAMENASKLNRCAGAKHWDVNRRDCARQRMLDRIRKNPECHPNRKLANNRVKMSWPERLVYDVLAKNKIDFLHNPNIFGKFPDFVIGKKIVEVDGERFHDKEKDAKRDLLFNSLGYEVYRIPAKIASKNPEIVLSYL